MAKNLVYLGVVVLAVIAVILGYNIYQQQTGGTATLPNTQPSKIQSAPQTGGNQSSTQPTTQKRELTAEEKQVLTFPGPNATEAEKKTHTDLVDQLGNKSGYAVLDISGCAPFPVVYRIKQGGSISIKNSDKVDHVINTARKVTIKADSTQTVNSKEIGDNLGEYAYACDGSRSSVGILKIIP